jgi:hypothetical protein
VRKSLSVLLCITATTGLATARFGIDVPEAGAESSPAKPGGNDESGWCESRRETKFQAQPARSDKQNPSQICYGKLQASRLSLRPTTPRPVESKLIDRFDVTETGNRIDGSQRAFA